MSNLRHIAKTQIAKFPEVVALVVTDEAGSLLEVSGDLDGEACGAIHAVVVQTLLRCGESLGLGELQRTTLTAPRRSCLIAVYDREIIGVYVDASNPLTAFEKKLESAMRR
jgi:predicted regulator of Ras-like GTPase activity (Roadblock/LC7/MglB family)